MAVPNLKNSRLFFILMVLPNHFQISTMISNTEMNNFSDVNNETKMTISEEFRYGQTPENLEKDTLDIYEELEALPEAV